MQVGNRQQNLGFGALFIKVSKNDNNEFREARDGIERTIDGVQVEQQMH